MGCRRFESHSLDVAALGVGKHGKLVGRRNGHIVVEIELTTGW